MRSEAAMLDLILAFGRGDDNIRAVTLNGSRVDPRVVRDPYMDYDVVFHVRTVAPFIKDPGWSRAFGKIVIAQTPYFMETDGAKYPNFMSWYTDGSRTDIRVLPLDELADYLREDSLTKVLLDKDGLIPELPEASDLIHHLKKPSQQKLKDSVNEFYWVSLYVTKALARGQLIAAAEFLAIVRGELFRLLAWNAAHDEAYTINFGSHWKFLDGYLTSAEHLEIRSSYDLTDAAAIKNSLTRCRALFAKTLVEYCEKTAYSATEDVEGILELEKDWLDPLNR